MRAQSKNKRISSSKYTPERERESKNQCKCVCIQFVYTSPAKNLRMNKYTMLEANTVRNSRMEEG